MSITQPKKCFTYQNELEIEKDSKQLSFNFNTYGELLYKNH